MFTAYEVASWHSLGRTVDEVGPLAYGGGAVQATAEIVLMSWGPPGEGGHVLLLLLATAWLPAFLPSTSRTGRYGNKFIVHNIKD